MGSKENLGSLKVQLTADDLADIEEANVPIVGARYPDAMLKMSGR
ncbi:hypothetical protein [Devosia sp. 2618]